MTRSKSFGIKLLAALMVLLTSLIVQASDQQSPLTEEEWQLSRLVNEYREDNGLSAVLVTNSLTKVARTHVADLNTYHPDSDTFGTGDCNRHSWSSHGDWTAVCYTGSAQASQMWNKPREITESYNGNGYEIAYWNSQVATPSSAMSDWMSSSAHSDTILQRGIFAGTVWQAMGVAIDGNYAVVWFGKDQDPAGPVPTTDPLNPEAAYDGLTLTAKKEVYAPGETVQFVLRKATPGSASLEGAHYEIEKNVDGEWRLYFKTNPNKWRFKTPLIEFGGVAKGFQWDQRQRGDPENVASRGGYRIKFYAPEAFDGFLTEEFTID
ncbi:MAG: CAP domain-containing protein [Methanotrichaceae archaeon]